MHCIYYWTNVLHILQRCTTFIHNHITLPTSVTHVHHTRNNNVLYMHTQTPQTTNVHHNHNITHCNVVLHIQHMHNSSNHRRISPPNTAHYNKHLRKHFTLLTDITTAWPRHDGGPRSLAKCHVTHFPIIPMQSGRKQSPPCREADGNDALFQNHNHDACVTERDSMCRCVTHIGCF